MCITWLIRRPMKISNKRRDQYRIICLWLNVESSINDKTITTQIFRFNSFWLLEFIIKIHVHFKPRQKLFNRQLSVQTEKIFCFVKSTCSNSFYCLQLESKSTLAKRFTGDIAFLFYNFVILKTFYLIILHWDTPPAKYLVDCIASHSLKMCDRRTHG